MNADGPIVEEVRERRRQLSKRFGHDLQGYARHLREIQEAYRDRHPVVDQVTVVPGEQAGPHTSG